MIAGSRTGLPLHWYCILRKDGYNCIVEEVRWNEQSCRYEGEGKVGLGEADERFEV